MKKKQYINYLKYITLILTLASGNGVFAAPIVIEGVVPNDASKQAILMKMRLVYGADQVVDKIQIRPVSAPNGWSDSVTQLIQNDLKKISQGKLTVRGTQVDLTGKLANPTEIQAMQNLYQSLVAAPYRFNSQFSANQAEQQLLDDTLKNRIIEFESGSAVLTATGMQILNEMANALNRVQNKNVKIIGHTDNQGQADKNMQLSLQRAETVKQYLIAKNIDKNRLSTQGLGASKAVADNATAEGRKKNRRIEFEVL